ncbi:MAG: hypothetical protein LBP78_05445 [Acidaminococcales bacterium]|nr:hypothetical protein [Acidaminococcales bacterium]
MFKKILPAALLSALPALSAAYAATAIDVPIAARDTAEAIREEAKSLLETETANRELRKSIEEMDRQISDLEARLPEARANLAALDSDISAVSLSQEEIERELADAQRRFDEALAETEAWQVSLNAAEERVSEARSSAEALREISRRSRRPEDDYKAFKAAERLQAAEENRDALAIDYAHAEIRMAEAQADLDKYTALHNKLTDAGHLYEDAQIILADLERDIDHLRSGRAEAIASLEEARRPAQINDRHWQYVMADMEYYSWKDSRQNRGRQLYLPVQYGYVDGAFSYGISGGYIISNSNLPHGKVSTLDDVGLSFAYEKKYKKFDAVYTLAVNTPTGKRTLYGSNAVMPDDLVRKPRFGEGWNFTPGVLLSWRVKPEDTWSLGLNYSINGRYRYDSSQPDGYINPANGLGLLVRYKHAGAIDQFVGELYFTGYTHARDNGLRYRSGNQIEPHLTYNRVLDGKNDLMFYYWYSRNGAPSSHDPNFLPGRAANAHFFGAMWSRKINAKSTFHITADYMKRLGVPYDPLMTTLPDHNKFAYGVKYDWRLTADSKISLHLQRFKLRDSGGNRYRGNNVYVFYNIYW